MGKCFIDSINNKFVLNGTTIAFEEFTKFKNGKILTLDGAEIIDSTLLSRLGVQSGKLTLDGLMVNSLDLSSVAQNIIPTTDISITLGSSTKKLANVYSDALTANSLVIGTGSAITFDGTVFRVGNDTLATREWVNSSAIPVLKTINGLSIIGTGDIAISGGAGGQSYMDIQYVMMTGGFTVQAPNVFVPFATNIGDSTIDYIYKIDSSTILIKAGVLYKLESNVNNVTDDDSDTAELLNFGLYSDVSGVTLLDTPNLSTNYSTTWTNTYRNYTTMTYIKSDVDCYLKLKSGSTTQSDSVGYSLALQTTLTKYNTTPIITTGTTEMPGYSTSEVLTEKRWIDGKPIYRKVVNLGTLTAENAWAYKAISLGITDIEKVIDSKVFSNVGMIQDVSYFDTPSNHIAWYFNNSSFVYTVSTNNANIFVNVSVAVEYTKTTDSASSKVATQNLVATQGAQALPGYSTTETLTEKRWIDGKPIYRKVLGDFVWTGNDIDVPFDVGQESIIDKTFLINNVEDSANSHYVSDTNESRLTYNTSAKTFSILYYDGATWANGYKFKIIVEYTKTADTNGSPVALVGGVTDTTISRFVGFSAINSVAQSLTANTTTKIILDTREFDSNASYDTTNSKYVVPVSGYYNINGIVSFNSTGGITCYLYKNGTQITTKMGVNVTGTRTSITATLYLNKGDYIELYGLNSVATSAVAGYCTLSATLQAPIYGGQNTLSDYSTTETLTERRWIDGKPIYRKVLTNLGAVAYQTWGNVSAKGDIESICTSYAKYSSTIGYIPVLVSNTATNITVYSPSTQLDAGWTLVFEYTKATDTSASPVAYIAGGGSPKKYYARLSNSSAFSFARSVTTTIPLNTLVKGDAECSDGVNGFIAPQDDVYTIESNYFYSNSTMVNVQEVIIDLYVNGVMDTRFANSLSVGGNNKSCNGSVSLKLAKGDKVTFKMWCWALDTTTALSVPVGSLVANIRN